MIEEKITAKLEEVLKPHEYPSEELAGMVAQFYKTLIEQEIDEAWARKLTEIYLAGF